MIFKSKNFNKIGTFFNDCISLISVNPNPTIKSYSDSQPGINFSSISTLFRSFYFYQFYQTNTVSCKTFLKFWRKNESCPKRLNFTGQKKYSIQLIIAVTFIFQRQIFIQSICPYLTRFDDSIFDTTFHFPFFDSENVTLSLKLYTLQASARWLRV